MVVQNWVDSKSTGDLVEEEFVQHCLDFGWTLLDLTARFRSRYNAPVAKHQNKEIKVPDYMISKPPLAPSLVAEIKGKDPVRDEEYWYDDFRWEYFKEMCNEFSVGGLLVFKHSPYAIPNLDNFFCATVEHLTNNIFGHHRGGPARNGKDQFVYTWKVEHFTPLKEFLTADLMSGRRYPFYVKRNESWVEI